MRKRANKFKRVNEDYEIKHYPSRVITGEERITPPYKKREDEIDEIFTILIEETDLTEFFNLIDKIKRSNINVKNFEDQGNIEIYNALMELHKLLNKYKK